MNFEPGDAVVITLDSGFVDFSGMNRRNFIGVIVNRLSNKLDVNNPYEGMSSQINDCYDVCCMEMQSGYYATVFVKSKNDKRYHVISRDYLIHVNDFAGRYADLK